MTWGAVDDKFHAHPKVLACSHRARSLWVMGLSWSMSYLTDGFIPQTQLVALDAVETGRRDTLGRRNGHGNTSHASSVPQASADELVTCGLWERVLGGYQMHDFADCNPLKEEILERKRRHREQVAEARRARAREQSQGGHKSNVTVPPPLPSPKDKDVPRDQSQRPRARPSGGSRAQGLITPAETAAVEFEHNGRMRLSPPGAQPPANPPPNDDEGSAHEPEPIADNLPDEPW